MPTDVDRLSDLANAASYLADTTCALADHAEAARAHYAAFRAASSKGREDRPSLGESHLRRAAEHDKVATEPESYAQKKTLAGGARKRADRDPTVANFRAASKASMAAAAAWRRENPEVKNANDWEVRDWDGQAKRWDDQADFLEKKGDKAADAAAVQAAPPPEPAKVAPEKPAKKMNAKAFAASASRE